MNTHKSKGHHVWRPRMNSEHEFNPFVRSSGSDEAFNHRAIDDSEEGDPDFNTVEDEVKPPGFPDD